MIVIKWKTNPYWRNSSEIHWKFVETEAKSTARKKQKTKNKKN